MIVHNEIHRLDCDSAVDVLERARSVYAKRKGFYRPPTFPQPRPPSKSSVDKSRHLSELYEIIKQTIAKIDEITGINRSSTYLINDVMRAVSVHFGVTKADIVSVHRTSEIMRARQASYILCRVLTNSSYPQIGRRHGRIDHSSPINAINKYMNVFKTLQDEFKTYELRSLAEWVARAHDLIEDANSVRKSEKREARLLDGSNVG